jgi:hypothetical protein
MKTWIVEGELMLAVRAETPQHARSIAYEVVRQTADTYDEVVSYAMGSQTAKVWEDPEVIAQDTVIWPWIEKELGKGGDNARGFDTD